MSGGPSMSSYTNRLIEQIHNLSSTSLHLTHKDREVAKVIRQLPWMRQNADSKVLMTILGAMLGADTASLTTTLYTAGELEACRANVPAMKVAASNDGLVLKWVLLLTLFAIVDKHTDRCGDVGILGSELAIDLLKNGRANDIMDAKLYFAVSRVYTLANQLESLCQIFVVAFHSVVLRSADMCIATIMNQLIHAYLALGDFVSAIQFTTVAKFPDETIRSTPQIVRCMFNLGRIHALQLHYAEALENLQNAVNKLPPHPKYAFGFKLLCYKYSIVVELLMGHIPSITIFRSPRGRYFRPKLQAYESLVLAVRNGDNTRFLEIVRQHSLTFRADGTLHLVERLHHAIQRVTLRKINLAYARISLTDIAKEIGVQNITDTESTVAKAIVDGVISGYIDAQNHCLVSKPIRDTYKTETVAESFSKRIMFSADMFFDAQRALQYPEEENLKVRAAEAEERRKTLAEERDRAEAGDVFEDEDDY